LELLAHLILDLLFEVLRIQSLLNGFNGVAHLGAGFFNF